MAPDSFTRSLIRWTRAQDGTRDALEALVIAGAGGLTTSAGGKQLTSATANGKSLSYTIPAGMDAMALLAKMEEALTIYDGFASESEVDRYLSTRPASRTVARFRSNYAAPGLYLGQ